MAGFICVGLGIIGVSLPVVPGIPFFILAAICFSKSSPKFHDMLMNNKLIGPHIKNYHKYNGFTVKFKISFILLQWVGILLSSIFFVHNLTGRILMLMIGVAGTAYILSLRTALVREVKL